MASSYNLQPNEVVLIKGDGVKHGGLWSSYSAELTLTNLNLIVTKKGTFGRVKETLTFPVNQIKVHNEQAQAMVGKETNGTDVLEVYFQNSLETFAFRSGGKRNLRNWVAKINEAVTGEDSAVQQSWSMAIPGADAAADVLKDTVDVFKTKFGRKPKKPRKAAAECSNCGGSMTGIGGSVATCGYCGSSQQL